MISESMNISNKMLQIFLKHWNISCCLFNVIPVNLDVLL